MNDKELESLYHTLNFDNVSFDTLIKACKLYNQSTFVIPEENIESFNDSFNKFMFKYISSRTEKETLEDLRRIREKGVSTFEYFDFLVKSRKYESFSETFVDIIISERIIPIYRMLYNKKFSKKFENVLKNRILEEETGIEYWTNQYDFPKDDKYKYYLPKLTDDEIDILIVKYIKSQSRNPNHLNALKTHKNSIDSYIIRPERFPDIEKAYEDCFNDPHILIHRLSGPIIEIGIAEDIRDIPFYKGRHNGHDRYVSSKSFIDKNLAYDKYINILRYSLRLVDIMGRISGIFNPYNEEEKVLFENKTVNQYGGLVFDEEEQKRNHHFMVVSSYLFNINSSIERYLENTVNIKFQEKYGIKGFEIDLDVNGDYKLKCEHLFNEMQGFVKQFDSYCRVKKVSYDLIKHLSFSSYSSIKSLINDKYYSVNPSSSIIKIFHLLFSYQSSLRHIDAGQDNELSLLDLMLKFNIKKAEYKWKDSLKEIDFLIQNGIIEEVDGLLKIKSLEIVSLLKELHEKGFVTDYYLEDKYKETLKKFLDKGWVTIENSLLSSLESDYFEYYLSDKKYSGNPAIRNKYGHGATYVRDDETFMDYCIGLRLFTILIIKVYEEFDIQYKKLNVKKEM